MPKRTRFAQFVGAALLAVSAGCAPGEDAPEHEPAPPTAVGDSHGSADAVADPLAELREQLSDPNQDTRLAAVRDLAAMRDPATVPLLRAALSDVDFRVRRDAAGALGELGEAASPAIDELAACLRDEYAFVRERAVVAITRIGGDEAVEAVRAYARDVDLDSVDQALDALGMLGDPRGIEEVRPYAVHEDLYIRRSAHRALVRIGEASAPTLRELLDHDLSGVRCTASRSLGVVGADEDLARLQTVAGSDPDLVVRACAWGGLGRLGADNAVEALTALVRDGPEPQAEAAIESLALIGDQAAINRIIDALPRFHDPALEESENVAMHALIALGEQARATVAIRVIDTQGLQRALVARVLAVTGGENNLPALQQAMATEVDPHARESLEDAIGSIEGRAEQGRAP